MSDSLRSEPYPLARKKNLISEEISGECLVYDSLRKKAHLLNTTLSWVWRRCDGTTTLEGLSAAFEQEFKVDSGKEVVLGCLRQLAACQLLDQPVQEVHSEARMNSGISRRAVIAGGSVVWPAVVSIVAPTAAAAKSKMPKYKDKGGKSFKRSK